MKNRSALGILSQSN